MAITPEQERALILTSRRRILEFFLEQPESIKTEALAERLEESSELITYHLRVLKTSGFINKDGEHNPSWSLKLEPDEVRAMLDQVKPKWG